ncbi:Pkinase-domain-containing protein [Dichomitus squalens]|uniref:Pkinase-domain-containing protein n=1 Tax=Dichomitus squalens TaxID=114155 RepID=A0A4V2K963_9APHY|nr:Pkinase-domain-containing protein [Dichomitus squalens]
MAESVDSPPRAPPVKYATPLGTRWQKEKAAAGSNAFEYPDDAKYVGPWIIGECVGKGASGHVKIAKHRRTGQLAAIKILPLQPFLSSRNSANAQAKAEKQRLGIDREIIMMKLMNHPNIMRIYDVYEGDKELYLILEYVEGGELFDFLVNRGRLPPLEALAYFKQIVYGLNYAHTFSIIHRDLKPENILIHSLNPPLIKIADWGMAAFAPPSLQLETSCGSPHYASPEIVNGHKYCGTATDIWSCGVILYALLTGRLPFDDKNVRTLLTKVKTGKYEMPGFVDPMAKDLLSRMLVVDVNQRISMADILAHPWLEGVTPGITYVPAPPVFELARPLPSALHIDRDLFESLCVIWGRHADVDAIQRDLLSSAGQGTLAKAFYFLLQKHREMTMQEHGILMDIEEVLNTQGKVVTKQYAAPRSKPAGRRSLESALSGPIIPASKYLRSDRPAPAPPSRTPSPPPAAIADINNERPVGRSRPSSPLGPRPQKSRLPVGRNSVSNTPAVGSPPSSFIPNPDHARIRSQTVGSANEPRERASALTPRLRQPTPPQQPISLVEALRDRSSDNRQRSTRAPERIHSPVPVSAAVAPMSPLSDRTDVGVHGHPQGRVPSYGAADGPQPPETRRNFGQNAPMLQPRIRRPEHRPSLDEAPSRRHTNWSAPEHRVDNGWAKAPGSENKENRAAPATRPVQHDPACHSGGLGFGHSVPMAKEMGNMLFINESPTSQQHGGKREKKHRPPPLDFSNAAPLQKRSTFSMGSPTRVTSPGPASALSPGVGEFKGWFSNLFHWRVQTLCLYSILDVATTRAETTRLLEHFGVLVSTEDKTGLSVLLCRVDEGAHTHDGTSLSGQKQVRFRVEFSSCSGSAGGVSSPIGAFPTASTRNRMADNVPGAAGYDTMIGIALEKGSVSTFKNLCQRLRTEWRLDALVSPM